MGGAYLWDPYGCTHESEIIGFVFRFGQVFRRCAIWYLLRHVIHRSARKQK